MEDIKNTQALEPCPFCGSTAIVQNNFGREYWVQCDDMECGSTDGKLYDGPNEAIAAWNKRASPPAAPVDAQRWIEIGKAVERACRELPDGFDLHLELENGAGTVRLYLPDDDASLDDFEGDTFADRINFAIDAALAPKEIGK